MLTNKFQKPYLLLLLGGSFFCQTAAAQGNIRQAFYRHSYTEMIRLTLADKTLSMDQRALFLATAHFQRAELLRAMDRDYALLNARYFSLLKKNSRTLWRKPEVQFYYGLFLFSEGNLTKAAAVLGALSPGKTALANRARLWRQAVQRKLSASGNHALPANPRNAENLLETTFISVYGNGAAHRSSAVEPAIYEGNVPEFLAQAAFINYAAGQYPRMYDILDRLFRQKSADYTLRIGKNSAIHLYNPVFYRVLWQLDYGMAIHYFRKIESPKIRAQQQTDFYLGKAYFNLRQYQKALALFSKLSSLQADVFRAAALLHRNQRQTAATIIAELEKNSPEWIRSQLGYLLAGARYDLEKAQRLAGQALEEERRKKTAVSPVFYQKLGWVLLNQKKYEAAFKTFNTGYDYTNYNKMDRNDPVYVMDFNIARFHIGRKAYADILGSLYAFQKKYSVSIRLYDLMQYLATPNKLIIIKSPTQ